MSRQVQRRRRKNGREVGGFVFSLSLGLAILAKIAYVAVRAAMAVQRVAAVAKTVAVAARAARVVSTVSKVVRVVKAGQRLKTAVGVGRKIQQAAKDLGRSGARQLRRQVVNKKRTKRSAPKDRTKQKFEEQAEPEPLENDLKALDDAEKVEKKVKKLAGVPKPPPAATSSSSVPKRKGRKPDYRVRAIGRRMRMNALFRNGSNAGRFIRTTMFPRGRRNQHHMTRRHWKSNYYLIT